MAMAEWLPVDWTSYIPSAITGVVGLAGIGGSIWSARITGERSTKNLLHSINAQNKLARDAEKRRLYAANLAAFNEVATALVDFFANNREEDQEEYKLARQNLYNAQRDMNGTLEELMLIAPKDVGVKAVDLSNHFRSLMQSMQSSEQKPDIKVAGLIRTALVRAMRDDLGEDNW
jgi:hypothetical protein